MDGIRATTTILNLVNINKRKSKEIVCMIVNTKKLVNPLQIIDSSIRDEVKPGGRVLSNQQEK